MGMVLGIGVVVDVLGVVVAVVVGVGVGALVVLGMMPSLVSRDPGGMYVPVGVQWLLGMVVLSGMVGVWSSRWTVRAVERATYLVRLHPTATLASHIP